MFDNLINPNLAVDKAEYYKTVLENERASREQADKEIIDLLHDVKNRYDSKLTTYMAKKTQSGDSNDNKKGKKNAGKKPDKPADQGSANKQTKQDDDWGAAAANDQTQQNDDWGTSNTNDQAQQNDDWGASNTNDQAQQNDGWGTSDANDQNQQNDGWGASNTNDQTKQDDDWGATATNDQTQQNDDWGASNTNDQAQQNDDWGASNTNDQAQQNDDWGTSTTNDQAKKDDDWGGTTTNDQSSKKEEEGGSSGKKGKKKGGGNQPKQQDKSANNSPVATTTNDKAHKSQDRNTGAKNDRAQQTEKPESPATPSQIQQNELKSQLWTAKLDLRLLERDKSKLIDEVTGLKAERDELIKKLSQANQENDSMKVKVRGLTVDLLSANEDMQKLNERIDELESERRHRERDVTLTESKRRSLESKYGKYQQQIADLQSELNVVKEEKIEYEKRAVELTKRNERLESDMLHSKNLIRTLKDGCALVENQARTFEIRHDTVIMSKADLERELIAIKEESSRHITTINKLQKSNEQISKAFVQSVEAHEACKKEVEKLHREYTRKMEVYEVENLRLVEANKQLRKVIDHIQKKR